MIYYHYSNPNLHDWTLKSGSYDCSLDKRILKNEKMYEVTQNFNFCAKPQILSTAQIVK